MAWILSGRSLRDWRRLEIKYTVSNSTDLKTSGELVICNFTPEEKQAALF